MTGSRNTLGVFGTSHANVAGFKGLTGVFAGSIYAILAFIGFEAAAPLAEEARNPRRTIRQAVIYSCLGIGIFYVLTTYAATVFFGPDKMGGSNGFIALNDGDPWEGLGHMVWGAAWFVFLAIVNSAIANSNAGANATTRTWYAMGRIRLLPSLFASVHPHWKSPHVAVIAQLPAFILIATMATAVVVLIYIALNLASIVFHLRERRSEFNLFTHGVVPVVGILFFVPGWLTAVGIHAFSFIAHLTGPASRVGIVVGAWYLIGVIYLIYLYSRAPQRVRDTGRIFIEPEPAAAAPAPTA